MNYRTGQMHLTASIQGAGYYPGSWRHPRANASVLADPSYYCKLARTAERGKLDLLFLDHTAVGERLAGSGREPGLPLEPFTLLGGAISATKHIGLGAAVSTSVIEPFAVARQLAALDHLSGGRLAWLASAESYREPKRRLGGPPELSRPERIARMREFVDVAARLWDSWEDDAVIIDRASGRYIDADKVRLIRHTGDYFQVRGPLSIPRPPQGHPVRIGLNGRPGQWEETGGETSDLVFVFRRSLEESAEFYKRIRRTTASQGRSADSVKLLTAVTPILGGTEEEARNRAAELASLVDAETGAALLSDLLQADAGEYPPDAALPAPLLAAATAAGLQGLTLRELIRQAVGVQADRLFVGTPEQLADWMEAWYRAFGSDGFHLRPALLPDGLGAFVDEVVPLLQQRGLFRTEYDDASLRDRLGLRRPATMP